MPSKNDRNTERGRFRIAEIELRRLVHSVRVASVREPVLSRRDFLRRASIWGLGLCGAAQVRAVDLILTPAMTQGPFYPDRLPLDSDNDLLIIGDGGAPAIGLVTHLSGRLLTLSGAPLQGAVVEIWQCDRNGVYIHSRSANRANRDSRFQGFGRCATNPQGEYSFRTIKPVPYSGRAPHIHFAVHHGGKRVLTTQMLVKGHPMNERDGVFRAVRDPVQRAALLVEFRPLAGSPSAALTARFDLVLGLSPEV